MVSLFLEFFFYDKLKELDLLNSNSAEDKENILDMVSKTLWSLRYGKELILREDLFKLSDVKYASFFSKNVNGKIHSSPKNRVQSVFKISPKKRCCVMKFLGILSQKSKRSQSPKINIPSDSSRINQCSC